MQRIDAHVNVLTLLGGCTSRLELTGEIFVLMEFCEHGSLKKYLEDRWSDFVYPPSNGQSSHSVSEILFASERYAKEKAFLE